MTTKSSDVQAMTSYRILGHPKDLPGHLDALGPVPIPVSVSPQWRAGIDALLVDSGLSGRGGGGFPAARKLAVAREAGRGGLVVVNAMEGEPASDKDKVLLLYVPHLVLDGAEVLAAACGAAEVVVCVPEGRDHVAGSVSVALRERSARGDGRVPIRLVRPPDRFVAGEESALAAWLESGLSLPTFRPDKGIPLVIGKRGALVQNAETLAHLGMLARTGAAAFRQHGLPEEPGTTLVTLSGSVARPGVVEVDRGTPLYQVVERAAPTLEPQALLVGGYGGTWVGPQHFGVPYASLALRTIGATAGVGIIVVLGPQHCGISETARIASYMAGQSAGQCGPCVNGLPAIANDLHRLSDGIVDGDLMPRLERRLSAVNGRGACRHPDGVVTLVRSALAVFGADVNEHLGGTPCAHTSAPGLAPIPERA
jgi:NADH:ubiquinone oxidoreductase subunit F (NADH-binding)